MKEETHVEKTEWNILYQTEFQDDNIVERLTRKWIIVVHIILV